jgi:hypothetical protein
MGIITKNDKELVYFPCLIYHKRRSSGCPEGIVTSEVRVVKFEIKTFQNKAI